jgi:hypothetical protein
MKITQRNSRGSTQLLLILLALTALALSACVAPIAAPPADATEPPAEESVAAPESDEDFVASITLPDGTECLNAGQGATMAFDGERVNYTCGKIDDGDLVLLGDLVSPMLDQLVVTRGITTHGSDGFSLVESNEITLRMSEVTLADGMLCLNAGQGATLGFDDKRVNYTCETTDEGDIVLLGDFQADGTALMVERGLVVRGEGDAGFELAESEMVSVSSVVGVDME